MHTHLGKFLGINSVGAHRNIAVMGQIFRFVVHCELKGVVCDDAELQI